jgi:hypothetical protein
MNNIDKFMCLRTLLMCLSIFVVYTVVSPQSEHPPSPRKPVTLRNCLLFGCFAIVYYILAFLKTAMPTKPQDGGTKWPAYPEYCFAGR